ncbi:MAG: serpin family protein [Candidatus Eisenbacteria bacterium]
MGTTTSRGAVMLIALVTLALPTTASCGCCKPAPAGKTGGTKNEVVVEVTDEDVEALVDGGNNFAFDLYARLAGDGNLFFSPYSISTALAMTAAGARGNTEHEMATTLCFPNAKDKPSPAGRERIAASFASLQDGLTASPETRGYELNIANSLWGQESYPFRESYIKLVATYFGGGFNPADFQQNAEAERVRINKWVEGETREKIKDLIPPGGVDPATTLVLTNAVYFKGQWLSRFDEERTSDATFHGTRGDATVPMMYQKGNFQYLENEDVQVLEMPYRGEEISMLVVLPRPESLVNLRVIESRLTAQVLSGWLGQIREKELKVYFPRFEMTWGTEDISGYLAALGIHDAFSSSADFSGMSDLKDLFIASVFHKAFVAVNEEGTEAAAATAVVMRLTIEQHETVFRADHPFLFVIRDDATGSILFMGRVADLG